MKHHAHGTGKEMSESSGEKQRLLIVDDSKVIRVTARKILQGNFETVEAVDGENAWEILTGMGPFSLVISDLTMPKLDGYGLLEKIRTAHDPDISNLPVIVITGDNDSKETMRRAREAGATDFIGKPFDAVHLLARAQSHASARAAHKSLAEQNIVLEDQALIDPQTGLANETAFMERGQQQLSYANRHNTTLTVAQVEIDNYGELSRKYGDPVTGMVTKYAASVLESGIRHEDMAARIGTARFAMLLTGMERNGVQALTERVCKNISARIIRYGSEEIHFTVSIGICSPDIQNDTSFDDLLTTAGRNLQQAIKQGGNRSIFDNAAPSAADAVTDETAADSNPAHLIDENISSAAADQTAGASPMAAQETAAHDEVLVMDDESIAEMLASAVEQPAPDDLADAAETAQQDSMPETVQLVSEPETAQQDSTSETETAETAPEDLLPEMFAEPVTGISKKLANKVAKARKLAAAEKDEVIVITAPYSAFTDTTLDTESQPEPADTATPAQQQEMAAESQAASPDAATSDDADTQRPGFFKRMLALFSRSGK
jgi:two-component system cell cycle response regulator